MTLLYEMKRRGAAGPGHTLLRRRYGDHADRGERLAMVRETVIASFILRFVRPGRGPAIAAGGGQSDSDPGETRIVVRHVQSGYERRFSRSTGDASSRASWSSCRGNRGRWADVRSASG